MKGTELSGEDPPLIRAAGGADRMRPGGNKAGEKQGKGPESHRPHAGHAVKKSPQGPYYAHSNDGPPDGWQPLEEHLREVSRMAGGFAAAFSSDDWAWNLGWLHDLGKATRAFQHYLKSSNGLDDPEYDADGSFSNHASAGAALAHDRLGFQGRALAYALCGHHAGLPDYRGAQTGNAALTVRLEEGRRNLTTILAFAAKVEARLRPMGCRPPDFINKENFHFWIRMLFSCLVDADRLDSERFGDPKKHALRDTFPSLGKMAPAFFQALGMLEVEAPKSDVNRTRSEVRQACERAAEGAPGLFGLSVPTGGGKTLSAMAFALRHALRHEKRRIIYVIPYTSIIEQTAKVLGGILGPENVVEHHSNIDPEDPNRRSLRSELAAENWDGPIIVTTNVQFFESLYSARPGRARKLHNIANSVVILDEAQLIPPELLTPCTDAIRCLVRDFGVTMVLATATQPALPGLPRPVEIAPEGLNLYQRLRRTEISMPADPRATVSWSSLADELSQHDQALCIVNTRRDCHDLFRRMPAGSVYLSALMCGAHRSNVIEKIKQRLKSGAGCRVVSTQLVEAGVDLDFPVVFRALAGLDSIAQAAGRCNREGLLDAEGRLGQVRVFVPEGGKLPALLRKGADKTVEMLGLPAFDPQSPINYGRYFELFYSSVNDTGTIFLKYLVNGVSPDVELDFRTAGSEFKIIDESSQQTVLVRWGGNDSWLAQLRAIGPTREGLRALQRSCVTLSKRRFQDAVTAGLVEEIWPGYWLWIGKYDNKTGLDIFGDGFSPEELIG